MQKLIHEKPNIHPIFDEFDRVYSLLSEHTETPKLIPTVLDSRFSTLYDTFVEQTNHQGYVEFKDKVYPKLKYKSEPKTVIVCFSGGKDSIAVVKYYLAKGYKVHLYHLRHINSALNDEYLVAQEIAEYLNVPIYIDDIKLSGHHEYVEHPMKNYIIANGALQYGIISGVGTYIAIGNYKGSTMYYDNFEFCGGDDMEMWDIYNDIMSTLIPKFKMHVVLKDIKQTLETVCADKPLLDLSVSCLGRASMRTYWHDWVLNKYGVMLPKHRCGRCYKCCVEYIYMADHDLQEYNEDYYKYCFTNLQSNVEREDNEKYYLHEVWEHYFFYSYKKSKYFKGDMPMFKRHIDGVYNVV